MKRLSPTGGALLEALCIVALWSATPPLSKIVMATLSPFEFMALRYSVAFLALVPIVLHRTLPALRRLSKSGWLRLVLMGVLAYPLANGLQFWALTRLTATTGTFPMNFVPLFALMLGVLFLRERPTRLQAVGVVLALVGAVIFFGFNFDFSDTVAIAASIFGSLLLAINAIMARSLARTGEIDSFGLSAVPLGVGASILMFTSAPQELPPPNILGLILFLGIVSGAFAYTVWNHAMKQLQAFELTIIGNLAPLGTAVLSFFILGELVPLHGWLGLAITLVGVILVGLRAGLPRKILSFKPGLQAKLVGFIEKES